MAAALKPHSRTVLNGWEGHGKSYEWMQLQGIIHFMGKETWSEGRIQRDLWAEASRSLDQGPGRKRTPRQHGARPLESAWS